MISVDIELNGIKLRVSLKNFLGKRHIEAIYVSNEEISDLLQDRYEEIYELINKSN